jgi:hypothetical protein
MKNLCQYYLYLRGCTLEGVFVLTDEELNSLQSFEIYYGEVAGKHSEVIDYVNKEDINIISTKIEDIEYFERLFPNGVGFKFKKYWFDFTDVIDDAISATELYKTAEEALEEDCYHRNNIIQKEIFIKTFNEHIKLSLSI